MYADRVAVSEEGGGKCLVSLFYYSCTLLCCRLCMNEHSRAGWDGVNACMLGCICGSERALFSEHSTLSPGKLARSLGLDTTQSV